MRERNIVFGTLARSSRQAHTHFTIKSGRKGSKIVANMAGEIVFTQVKASKV